MRTLIWNYREPQPAITLDLSVMRKEMDYRNRQMNCVEWKRLRNLGRSALKLRYAVKNTFLDGMVCGEVHQDRRWSDRWNDTWINRSKWIKRGEGRHLPCGVTPRWLITVHCLSRSSESPATRDMSWRLNALQPTFPFSAFRVYALPLFPPFLLPPRRKRHRPEMENCHHYQNHS